MTCIIKKISIIIPCYNSDKFLEDAIKSVLNQSYKKFDLYLVNNGSVDKSLDIMQKYKIKDKRIYIINYKKKTPKGKSINNLLDEVKTKWVSILDADDIYFKNKIKYQINFLQKNNNVKLLSCLGTYTLDGISTFGTTNNPFKNLKSCFNIINKYKNIGVLAPGVIFDKDVVIKIGGIRYKYWPSDDIDLSNRIAEKGYIVYSLPKILMMYRMSRDSSMAGLKSFIKGKKKAGWAKYTLKQRINHKSEISFSSYISQVRNKNILMKLSNFLEDCSDYFFRETVVQILKKNIIMISFYIILSFLFRPYRILKKISNRILKQLNYI